MNRIIPAALPYKKPVLEPKGSAYIWITWSKADKSNSFMEFIWANAFLPIYWMLFGRTILDFTPEQYSKADLPMCLTPSSKLMLIISLLVNKQWGEL